MQQTKLGAKPIFHPGKIDPGKREFVLWHHDNLGPGCMAFDVDCIEWRWRYGTLFPVGVIEYKTWVPRNGAATPPPAFLDAVLKKSETQQRVLRFVADSLGCNLYTLVARNDFGRFWLHCSTDESRAGWMLLAGPAALKFWLEMI